MKSCIEVVQHVLVVFSASSEIAMQRRSITTFLPKVRGSN